MRIFIMLISFLLLTACSLQPQSLNNRDKQVEVSQGVWVALPKPAELQQTLNVSQLITAQWGETDQQKLLVQLQVDEQQVVLAGFSSWGARLLSLTYNEQKIETYVMTGLADTLPKPEQVLFNVMLSIWPIEAWQASFRHIGWQLIESDLQRTLLNKKGETVINIRYENSPYLAGNITFEHLILDYQIVIETNDEL